MSGDPWKDIRRDVQKDSFERGAEAISDLPIAFIDPKKMKDLVGDDLSEEDLAKNAPILKSQMEEQYPGILSSYTKFLNDDREPGSPVISEIEALHILVDVVNRNGPFVITMEHEGEKICIINKSDVSLDNKEEVVEFMSRMSMLNQQPIPDGVTDETVQRYVGAHEAAHCNQSVVPENMTERLMAEASADRVASRYMRGLGDDATPDLVEQSRALGLVNNAKPWYGVSGLLRTDDTHVTKDHTGAMYTYESAVDKIIMARIGMSEDDFYSMKFQDFARYADMSDAVTKEMKESGTPLEKAQAEYQEVYMDAVRERIYGIEAPDRNSDVSTSLAVEGMGEPDVAGDAGLAARAAEQAGADPSVVTSIAPKEPEAAPAPMQQQPDVSTSPMDFAY